MKLMKLANEDYINLDSISRVQKPYMGKHYSDKVEHVFSRVLLDGEEEEFLDKDAEAIYAWAESQSHLLVE